MGKASPRSNLAMTSATYRARARRPADDATCGVTMIFGCRQAIDQTGAAGKLRQPPGVEDARGLRRARQQRNQDVGLREEGVQPACAGMALDARKLLGRAGPTGDAEAEAA